MININNRQVNKLSHSSHRSNHQSRAFSENRFSKFASNQTSRKSTLPNDLNRENKGWSFLQARKESQLNSMFNIRKHKLNQITRANLAIYEKINTQQSYYGHKYQTKSKQNCGLSREKFKTVEESRNSEKFKSILGPICNFNALTLPKQLNQFDIMEMKQTKLRSLPAKQVFKKKTVKKTTQQNGALPNLFTFY